MYKIPSNLGDDKNTLVEHANYSAHFPLKVILDHQRRLRWSVPLKTASIWRGVLHATLGEPK